MNTNWYDTQYANDPTLMTDDLSSRDIWLSRVKGDGEGVRSDNRSRAAVAIGNDAASRPHHCPASEERIAE